MATVADVHRNGGDAYEDTPADQSTELLETVGIQGNSDYAQAGKIGLDFESPWSYPPYSVEGSNTPIVDTIRAPLSQCIHATSQGDSYPIGSPATPRYPQVASCPAVFPPSTTTAAAAAAAAGGVGVSVPRQLSFSATPLSSGSTKSSWRSLLNFKSSTERNAGLKPSKSVREDLDAWIEILQEWDSHRHTKSFRRLVQQGIPHEIRGEVWKRAIGDSVNLTPQLYTFMCRRVIKARTFLIKTSRRYRERIKETLDMAAGTVTNDEPINTATETANASSLIPTVSHRSSHCWSCGVPATHSAQCGFTGKPESDPSMQTRVPYPPSVVLTEACKNKESNKNFGLAAVDTCVSPHHLSARSPQTNLDSQSPEIVDGGSVGEGGQIAAHVCPCFCCNCGRRLDQESAKVFSNPAYSKVGDHLSDEESWCETEVLTAFESISLDLHRTLPRLGVVSNASNWQVGCKHRGGVSLVGGVQAADYHGVEAVDSSGSSVPQTPKLSCDGSDEKGAGTEEESAQLSGQSERPSSSGASEMRSSSPATMQLPHGVRPIPFSSQDCRQVYESLRMVLEAYAVFRPDIGYVQGMAYIAAMLLLYMDEYSAFVALNNMLLRRSLAAFYSFDLNTLEVFFRTFDALFIDKMPSLFQKLCQDGLKSDIFLVEWMYTLFTRSLPFELVTRIWDNFVIEGEVALFQAGLAILLYFQSDLEKGSVDKCMSILSSSTTTHFDTMLPNRFFECFSSANVNTERLEKMMRNVKKALAKTKETSYSTSMGVPLTVSPASRKRRIRNQPTRSEPIDTETNLENDGMPTDSTADWTNEFVTSASDDNPNSVEKESPSLLSPATAFFSSPRGSSAAPRRKGSSTHREPHRETFDNLANLTEEDDFSDLSPGYSEFEDGSHDRIGLFPTKAPTLDGDSAFPASRNSLTTCEIREISGALVSSEDRLPQQRRSISRSASYSVTSQHAPLSTGCNKSSESGHAPSKSSSILHKIDRELGSTHKSLWKGSKKGFTSLVPTSSPFGRQKPPNIGASQ